MTSKKLEQPLRIWAILGARAGDNDQVIALAEALKIPFEIKQLAYNWFRVLGPRLLGRSLVSLTRSSRELILAEPPPDLTISTGHRSVAAVQALRYRSGGRTRSIHVGFPRVSPERFDLVIATPQYPIPDQPNLLSIPYALTRAATSVANQADAALVEQLPRPRRLLIVGGPTLFWMIDRSKLLGTLDAMLGEAASDGGSVLVTSSPRTPQRIIGAIERALDASAVPSMLATPAKAPGYTSLLNGADSIRITADSVSMVSDAIWTGKPAALVPVRKSASGRMVMAVADLFRPGRRLYPQDLRFFWRALEEIGVGRQLCLPRTSIEEQMRRILDRVQPILGAITKANAP